MGNPLGVRLQQERQARKQNRALWSSERAPGMVSRPPPTQCYRSLRLGAEDFDGSPSAWFNIAGVAHISSAYSGLKPMSSTRYIVVAVVRCSLACSSLPVRR